MIHIFGLVYTAPIVGSSPLARNLPHILLLSQLRVSPTSFQICKFQIFGKRSIPIESLFKCHVLDVLLIEWFNWKGFFPQNFQAMTKSIFQLLATSQTSFLKYIWCGRVIQKAPTSCQLSIFGQGNARAPHHFGVEHRLSIFRSHLLQNIVCSMLKVIIYLSSLMYFPYSQLPPSQHAH